MHLLFNADHLILGTALDWASCPIGTFSDTEGLYEQAQCQACPSGKYCHQEHQTTFTGPCSAGYYCSSGVDRPDPGATEIDIVDVTCSCPEVAFHRGVGGKCPLGHYCPEGSPAAIPCVAGYYVDTTGESVCTVCPAGYYCETGAEEYASTPCPTGTLQLYELYTNS